MVPRREALRSLSIALAASIAGCTDVFPRGDGTDTDRPGTPKDGSTPTTAPAATLSPTPEPTPTPSPTPTFEAVAGTPAFSPAGDRGTFGAAVALSSELAVVGAPADEEGSVHVFEAVGDGWTPAGTFVPEDAHDFGRSVALSGETVLVGAPDTASEGAVFVFERTGDGWTRRARLLPWEDDGDDFREFGRSVAYDGETAVVGDVTVHVGPESPFKGAVFVFEGAGEEWREVTRLATGESDMFGTDVALSGGRMLVGAPYAETGRGETRPGAAYVYERTDGKWQRRARLVPEDAADRGFFGGTVALSGTTAVVAAPRLDGRGAAYVFERTGGGWRQRARLSPGADAERDAEPDEFGVACGDGVAVVGVPRAPESGRADTFERANGEWRRASTLSADAPDPDGDFGRSVALAGDTALVGAPCRFCGDRTGHGYLFDL